MRFWNRGKELITAMEKTRWSYQNILKENKLENRFDNFLQYLLNVLKRKYANSIGSSISQNIKLSSESDCALVYNPQSFSKHPKLVLHIPGLYEGGYDNSPHFVMMAVIAKMILEQDPEFEAFIAKKVSNYVTLFEKEEG
jgi:hypothetical protein